MSGPVAVTGIGLVAPAAIGVPANWERLCPALPTAAADAELNGLRVTCPTIPAPTSSSSPATMAGSAGAQWRPPTTAREERE